ncbi:hydroxymethylglutaryl-CoA lyase [Luteitalea sp. TBR-22]|uniref:hydroxymethylglutaryl-CoA lyase n=1 Tax=Luteitalea sp. TBR-22 TaxID=2802971 RepID=UPI001AFA8A29|nr:hydroxymethylglutaryl-CoA lyase [Luteitalea sp. TBR-22]BCS33998.1 hydroxymethylglutaryl-CoA lyase [Luteitalea sp. TBR-22]
MAAVSIVELGPRDGLQNEAIAVDLAGRTAFVRALAGAGLRRIEAGAFVRPDRVPQMAGSDQLCAGLVGDTSLQAAGVRLSALVPNLKGLERAAAAGLREVAVFPAASETFSRQNLNQSVGEALVAAREVCTEATRQGIAVRGYVSTAFGCPYEGDVPIAAVARVCEALLAAGVHELAVSDTIGVAHPGQVRDVLATLMPVVTPGRLALHFHDTRGMALANVLVALEAGVTTFDACAGGLGGCPFAPGATGNLATEDLVYMLHGLGLAREIDLDALVGASAGIEAAVGHPLPSRCYRAARAVRRRA